MAPIRLWMRVGLLVLLVAVCMSRTDAAGPPFPPFWTIDAWSERVPPALSGPNAIVDPAGVVVRALCQFYDLPFDQESIIASSPSPFAWPRIFADETPDPRYLQARFERLARYNGLSLAGIVVFDVNGLADSLRSVISHDWPVVLNHPEWPVLYGYDTREPDAWWMVYRGGKPEILFESERRSDIAYWADDPAANLAWAATGPDTQSSARLTMDWQDDAYRWLETIHRSVQGDHDHGVVPYPLTVRYLRDSLASAAHLPRLATPIVTSDPLGIRRALRAREFAASLLEQLSMQVVDSSEAEPLRLALYFYHNSFDKLTQLDSLMYHRPYPVIPPRQLAEAWADESLRSQAIKLVTDVLEWEKQAAQQIEIVVTRRAEAGKPDRK